MKILNILILLCVSYARNVLSQAVNQEKEYLISQGKLSDGTIEMYSPYFLWHEDIYNDSKALTNPIELRSINGYLDVTFTVKVAYIENDLFGYNARVFCYNDICKSPGPTLYCGPNDTLRITLINELSSQTGIPSVGPLEGQKLSPNRTNIFIQGVALDPVLNNPFRYTSGDGDSLVYEYKIPSNAPPGINWYHSRVHGVSALQVMGGLYGAFIINPTPITGTVVAGAAANNADLYLLSNPLPKTLSAIIRQIIIFSHIMLEKPIKPIPGVRGNSFSLIDEAGSEGFSNSSLSYSYLSQIYGSQIPLNVHYNTSITTTAAAVNRDVWLTNGQYQPTYTLQPAEWRILDIVAASADRILELEVRTAVGYGQGSLACDIRLLAVDGVYLNTTRSGMAARHIVLLQASRASVAIMCADPGRYYLQSVSTFDTSDPYHIIGDYQTKSTQNLLTIAVSGNDYIMDDPPSDLSSIVRPTSLLGAHNQPASSNIETISISTAQGGCCASTTTTDVICKLPQYYWFGVGTDCQPACYDKLLCAALQSVLTTPDKDSVPDLDTYTVRMFPTARNGDCTYSSSSSSHSNSSTTTITATLGAVQEITLWGHSDFRYPIFLQNQRFQVGDFANADISMSNIIESGEYVQLTQQNSSFYGQFGDFKEMWPALTGKSKLYLQTAAYPGSLLVMTSFLKYEDLGALRSILIQPAANLSDTPVTPPTRAPMSAPSTEASEPEPVFTIPPPIAQSNSDYASSQHLCNTTGASYYYTEDVDVAARVRTITTHSCPNHFSVCQSNECGGQLKTRALKSRQVVTVPLYPALNTALLDTTCNNMLLGVALNGVGIYGSSDGITDTCISSLGHIAAGGQADYTRELVGRTSCHRPGDYDGLRYCGDGVQAVATELDKCGGHADTDGVYKYQVTPVCLLQQLSDQGVREHSPQLGWALDGFPVFGPVGPKGVTMQPCGAAGAHPVLCLDICNGYAGRLPGYDQFLYRYYFTGTVGDGECSDVVQTAGNCSRVTDKCCISAVPDRSSRPYSIGCFRGCPYQQPIQRNGERVADLRAYDACQLSGSPGTTAEYQPTVAAYAKTVNSASNLVTSAGTTTTDTVTTDLPLQSSTDSNLQQQLQTNPRKVASRSAFNGVLSVLTFADTVQDPINNANSSNNTSMVSPELLERSASDVVITGMSVENSTTNIIYYATEFGIFSYDQVSKKSANIVTGLLAVEIDGYNMGASLADVSITVADRPCTSVRYTSPERVSCTLVLTEPNIHYRTLGNQHPSAAAYVSSVSDLSTATELGLSIVPYSIEQVVLTTPGGRATGIQTKPLTVVRSGSGRPTMAHITLALQPFAPYDVKVFRHPVSQEQTLYWSNVAYGAHSIHRSRVDGTQVEIVVNNVQRAVGLTVEAVALDSALQYTTTLAAPQCVELAAAAGYGTAVLSFLHQQQTTQTAAVDCVCGGHLLFFADAHLGTINRLALLPISTAEVYHPTPIVQPQQQQSGSVYTSAYHRQEQSELVTAAFLQPTVLLTGVDGVTALSIDTKSDFAFISAQHGVVLRLNYAKLLGTLKPVVVNMRVLLRHGSAGKASLPAWVQLLSLSDTRARVQDVCVLPTATSVVSSAGVRNVSAAWQQQRIIAVDANQQRLIGYTEEGLQPSVVDLGFRFDLLWPTQVQCFDAITSTGSSSTSSSLPYTVVYVSEFLGRVWKLQIQRDTHTGRFQFDDTFTAELVLDRSTFYASHRLRAMLGSPDVASRPFFDVY